MKRALLVCFLVALVGCSTQPKYPWKVVGRSQKAKFVYVSSEGIADSLFICKILGNLVIREDYNQIYIFDNLNYTPKQFPMSDAEMLHYKAKYVINPSNGHEEFVFIEVVNSATSPPELKEIESGHRPKRR